MGDNYSDHKWNPLDKYTDDTTKKKLVSPGCPVREVSTHYYPPEALMRPVIQKKYTSTKEYPQAFPLAYRQWKADSHCNVIHGYAMTFKFYFETDDLDVRNWAMDYGGLKPLKEFLDEHFDHVLLVAEDDPQYDEFMTLQRKGMAKITVVQKTGCEGLADWLYEYVNTVLLPRYGKSESERIWCSRVEVRENHTNMAYREGHREWNEFNE